MPTFLETLGQRDLVAERTQLALLDRDRRNLETLQRQAQSRQLLESCSWDSADPFQSSGASVAGLGSAVNDLHQYGAIGRHSARPGSRRHGAQPPYYFTEQQHWQQTDSARVVEAFCVTAKNMLEVLKQFIVHTGFTYTIVAKKKPGEVSPTNPPEVTDTEGEPPESAEPPKPKPNPLVDKTQEFLDKWMKRVKWHEWEQEIVNRTERDGENFLVFETDPDADDAGEPSMLELRALEPEQCRDPVGMTGILNQKLGITGNDATWRFGILTSKRNTSKPIAYNFVSQYNDTQRQHEVFEAKEVHHTKVNVDRNSKRGVSMFFPIFNALPRSKKLLRALSESAVIQANIVYVEEMPPGVEVGSTLPVPVGGSNITTRTGRQAAARMMDGPEALTVTANHKYHEGPIGKSETLLEVFQAALRLIGTRKQIPEGLISGDSSEVNRAAGLVSEGPFVKARQGDQKFYRDEFVEIMETVIDAAAVAGMIGPARENIFDDIEISVDMPPVVPRNAKEETERNQILNERGIMSSQTWSSREDLDFEDEQQLIAEHPIEPPSIMLGLPADEEAEDDTSKEGSDSNERERVS